MTLDLCMGDTVEELYKQRTHYPARSGVGFPAAKSARHSTTARKKRGPSITYRTWIPDSTTPRERPSPSNGFVYEDGRPSVLGCGFFLRHTVLSWSLQVSTTATMSQLPRGRDEALSTLDAAIGDLNLAEKTADATPAKAAFDSASVLLTLIRVDSHPTHVG